MPVVNDIVNSIKIELSESSFSPLSSASALVWLSRLPFRCRRNGPLERMAMAGDDDTEDAIAKQLIEHRLARQARHWYGLQAAAEAAELVVNT